MKIYPTNVRSNKKHGNLKASQRRSICSWWHLRRSALQLSQPEFLRSEWSGMVNRWKHGHFSTLYFQYIYIVPIMSQKNPIHSGLIAFRTQWKNTASCQRELLYLRVSKDMPILVSHLLCQKTLQRLLRATQQNNAMSTSTQSDTCCRVWPSVLVPSQI